MLGAKLRQLRRQRDITQTALAKEIGVVQGYIARIERKGTVPSNGVIERAAIALGVSPTYFTDGQNDGYESNNRSVAGIPQDSTIHF